MHAMCAKIHILSTRIQFDSIRRRWKKKRFCLQIAIFPNKFFLLLFFFVVCFLKKLVPFLDMIVILHELQQLCLKDFWLTFIVPHLEKREMKFEIEHRAHSYTFAELYVYFYCDCVNVTCVCMWARAALACVCIAVHFLSVCVSVRIAQVRITPWDVLRHRQPIW